jgi:hypothetical protein
MRVFYCNGPRCLILAVCCLWFCLWLSCMFLLGREYAFVFCGHLSLVTSEIKMLCKTLCVVGTATCHYLSHFPSRLDDANYETQRRPLSKWRQLSRWCNTNISLRKCRSKSVGRGLSQVDIDRKVSENQRSLWESWVAQDTLCNVPQKYYPFTLIFYGIPLHCYNLSDTSLQL